MTDRMLSKREAADFLGVRSLSTIDLYCRDYGLPFYRLPCGKRFKPSELEAWASARRVCHRSVFHRSQPSIPASIQ